MSAETNFSRRLDLNRAFGCLGVNEDLYKVRKTVEHFDKNKKHHQRLEYSSITEELQNQM